MDPIDEVAPAFVAMAHRIVWCTVATVDRSGRPQTRVLHPIWEWDGAALTGWIASDPASLKAKHLAQVPEVSLTYWAPDHDTCSAEATVTWLDDVAARRAVWDRFEHGPEPVGYDPRIVPGWDSPTAERFGVLELHPRALRVMDGSVMLRGEGRVLSWRA